MRRFLAPLFIAALLATVIAGGALAATGTTGNGAPSGPHYNLNIHGVANGQGWNGNNKNDIFVPLWGKCTIDLTRAASYGVFSVTDSNCVNDGNAAFTLPDPCVSATGATTCPSMFSYSVWARAMSPKGSAQMTTCYTDTTTGYTYCNTSLTLTLAKNQKFNDVSKSLLQICDNATGKQAAIFADAFYNYFWTYDNQGLRLAQLRFYPIPTGTSIGTTCTATPA
ncbi:MAG TPA: hypothetical protein VKR30_10000 [Candidatus Limnocylindrales bacterium]|nr:hypothetical protein [Candidatus Limnocylindrales bacterium]